MVFEFRMRNEIHGHFVSDGQALHPEECIFDDLVDSWLLNGIACKMFAEMLDRDLVWLCSVSLR